VEQPIPTRLHQLAQIPNKQRKQQYKHNKISLRRLKAFEFYHGARKRKKLFIQVFNSSHQKKFVYFFPIYLFIFNFY